MSLTPLRSNNTLGILCAVGAAVFFSAADVTVKFLSDTYALHQIIFLRSIIGISIIVVMVKMGSGSWHQLRTQHLAKHIIRGTCVVVANMLFFLGLAAMPLADTVALFFISPSIIALFSIVFLKEQVELNRWLAIAVGFVGVLIMVRPGSSSFQLASLLPIGAAFGYAALHTLTRTMRNTESATTMTFYIQVTFILVSLMMWTAVGDGHLNDTNSPSLSFLLRPWAPLDSADIKLFLWLGIGSTCAGYLISQAYIKAEAALAAPFEYIALPLAIFWGFVVFDEWPNNQTFIGSGLILISGVYTLFSHKSR